MLIQSVAAATLVAVMAVAQPAAADAAARPNPVPAPIIGCSQSAARVVLTQSARLARGCMFTAGFTITASDVTLDCQGATIRGDGVGHGIDVEAPDTEPLHDVHIRNCRVENFLNGIHVTRLGFTTLAEGVEYVDGFSDISVTDSHIVDNIGVGLYVDGYVAGVTVADNDISGNGSSGVYLDTGSEDNVVQDNRIHGNGFVENGPEGTDTVFNGVDVRFWGPGREGLSLDGSRFNRILDNVFWGNSAGSIFLYKNCGEDYISDAADWLPRRYGSDGNLIQGNRFTGGLNGVWVGSRMGENTYPMQCSAPAYFEAPLQRVVLDEATDNTVRDNTFTDVTYGVHVEDDRTTVADNVFRGSDPGDYAVIVGTRLRTTVLDQPVTGTVVADNQSRIVGNASPYRWVDGEVGTVMSHNLAQRRPAGICQAPEIPHNFMIMVIAVAAETPGQPSPPPPDLTVPTIGVLAPCAESAP